MLREKRKRRNFAELLVLTVIILAVLLTTANLASASFKGSSDWIGSKRTLKVKFDTSVTNQWKTWVKEAMQNWNNVKATTGWEFVETTGTSDIDIKLKNIPARKDRGGAETAGFDKDPIQN